MSTWSGSATGSTESTRKSMSRACPATPDAEASWSIRPHGTPDASCSARWPRRASSVALPSKPSARATASSSAALDDRPLPMGMVVDTVPSKP